LKLFNPNQIEDVTSINNIEIYPNPTSGNVFVGFTATEETDVNLSVITITGTEILSKNYNNIIGNQVAEINLANYAKGAYLIKIKTNKGSFVRKVVVE
jgi:hypothetical protein